MSHRRTRWRWRLAGTYAAVLAASYVVRGVVAPPIPPDVHLITLQAVSGHQRLSQPVRLAYREYRGSGGGTPVLLLHGSPGDSAIFEGLAAHLAGSRAVLAPDLPGFGLSSTKVPDYSFRAHARYVQDLLEAHGIHRAHVLGFSMGGGVALSLADLDPHRLDSLTMVSAIGVQEMELLGEYHLNHAVHGVQLAGLWVLSRAVPHTGTFDAPVSYARNFFDSDQRPLENLLRRISVPTLFVHGRGDQLVPIEAAIEHARLVPHSELHIVEDGHFTVLEHPQRIAHFVNDFLARVEGRRARTRERADPARVSASLPPFDPRGVPRARGVTTVVLGMLVVGASACCGAAGAIGAGVLAAQGRAGYAWTLLCCIFGSMLASARRRSPVVVARSAGGAVGGTSLGMVAGAAALGTTLLVDAGAWTRAFAVTGLICSALWLLTLAASFRQRRLLASSWLRLTHWEYWPPVVTYVPVVVYVLWLMLKHRSATAFTAVNPAIPAGGFIGESKIDILRGLDPSSKWVARSGSIEGHLPVAEKVSRAGQFMTSGALDLPVVLKPNRGQRGSGVVVARTWEALASYLQQSRVDTVIQEYVPGLEFGVFYCRKPSEPRGRILSITEKRLPTLIGDGRNTLERLILEDRRTLGMARFHLRRHVAALGEVPAAGRTVSLGDCGSHCRGATFLDGRGLLTPSVERTFEGITRAYDGFYFGRFDVRAASKADFADGRFRIIELNGVTSEATHIYDPQVGLWEAYRALFEQWRLAFEIGAENIARGAADSSIGHLARLLVAYRKEARGHLVEVMGSSSERV